MNQKPLKTAKNSLLLLGWQPTRRNSIPGRFVLLSSLLAERKRGSAARSSAHWPVLAFLCWQERQRGSGETRAGERRREEGRGNGGGGGGRGRRAVRRRERQRLAVCWASQQDREGRVQRNVRACGRGTCAATQARHPARVKAAHCSAVRELLTSTETLLRRV